MLNGSLDFRLLRLAYVNEWSDEMIRHVVDSCEARGHAPDEILGVAQKAAENLCLAALRTNGDPELAGKGAKGLGFKSVQAMTDFQSKHPLLSTQWQASLTIYSGSGVVVAISMTEVVFRTEGENIACFAKARLLQDCAVGDSVIVGQYGSVRKVEPKEVVCA